MVSYPVYAAYVVWHYREPDQEIREGTHHAILDATTWERLCVHISETRATPQIVSLELAILESHGVG
jgi:hypothetical protein